MTRSRLVIFATVLALLSFALIWHVRSTVPRAHPAASVASPQDVTKEVGGSDETSPIHINAHKLPMLLCSNAKRLSEHAAESEIPFVMA